MQRPGVTRLDQNDHGQIEALLIGRRIVAAEIDATSIPFPAGLPWWEKPNSGVAEGMLTLDDGTRIYALGNDGGCACSAGCYPLAHIAAVDNVITAVRFEDRPDSDDYYLLDDTGEERGWYRIFVVADAREINILSFEGTDGNGYYGTGYALYVWREIVEEK